MKEQTADSYITIAEVEETLGRFYPELIPTIKAGLAVFGAMALSDRTKPLSLILEGTSGFGKTAVIQMVFPLPGLGLDEYAYRSDKFTPRAFVSHAANVKRTKLRQIDMLPRLKGKVLLTKELAPIFRGREEELRENFSILISVLDGKGFTSDSGMHGKRGYGQPILFNWLGATTPLPASTHRLMHQLGTRLLFYEVPSVEPTAKELLAYAQREDSGVAEVECQRVMNEFLLGFFDVNPVGEFPAEVVEIPSVLLQWLTRWAHFLARGRAEVKFERKGHDWIPIAAAKPEGPFKIVNYFKDLVRGNALIHGRWEVTMEDLKLIEHVAISSIPGHLRPIVRELQKAGSITSSNCTVLCGVSQPTARKYLKELALLRIVNLTKGSPRMNDPDLAILTEDFQWIAVP